MAEKKAPPVRIKKVAPYPFQGELTVAAQKKPVEVILVTLQGFIVRLHNQIVHVGEYYQVNFELPGKHGFLNAVQVRALKTYDKPIESAKKLIVERIAEFHFQTLTKEQRDSITAFLAAIGQKK